jgi:hypothetical protein
MKPAWDTLMKEYEGHKTALVGDVDCTAAGKPLCDSNGVQGFPTIKHGDPSNLEDYKGGRDLDALQKFAKENLKPVCSPANIELCDEAQKAEIEKFKAMPSDELDKAIAEKEKEAAAAEAHFKAETDKLQKKYQELQKNKESILEAVTKSGLGMMKAVKAAPVKCLVKTPDNCSDKEKAFIEKMKAKSAEDVAKQVARLEKMKGDSMKAELKAWLMQRLAILKQL